MMRRYLGKRNNLVLFAALLALGGIVGIQNSVYQNRVSAQLPSLPATPLPSPTPVYPGDLSYRASLTGNYIAYVSPNTAPTFSNLTDLATASTDVITGTALTNACQLVGDNTFSTGSPSSIDTVYQIRVQTVFKGGLVPDSTIYVGIPGGRVVFQPCATAPCSTPSTTAEVRTPWFKKMSNGGAYTLFLSGAQVRIPPTKFTATQTITVFRTTGGPQGVFEMTSGDVIRSNSGRLRDPMWFFNGVGTNIFLGNVQAACNPSP